MSNLIEIQLEEKEISICMIPMNILGENNTNIVLEDDEMAVYIPKLMSSLPSTKPKNEVIKIDYSIIKNDTFPDKVMETSNFLLVKPYTENNLSPQLFNKGEKCFTKFLYKDIKQAYFTSDNLNREQEKLKDVKKLSVKSNKDIYELCLDSVNNLIKLGTKNKEITIDENTEEITIKNAGTQINLYDNMINIKAESINLSGSITINNLKLEDIIHKIVEDIIRQGSEENDSQ